MRMNIGGKRWGDTVRELSHTVFGLAMRTRREYKFAV